MAFQVLLRRLVRPAALPAPPCRHASTIQVPRDVQWLQELAASGTPLPTLVQAVEDSLPAHGSSAPVAALAGLGPSLQHRLRRGNTHFGSTLPGPCAAVLVEGQGTGREWMGYAAAPFAFPFSPKDERCLRRLLAHAAWDVRGEWAHLSALVSAAAALMPAAASPRTRQMLRWTIQRAEEVAVEASLGGDDPERHDHIITLLQSAVAAGCTFTRGFAVLDFALQDALAEMHPPVLARAIAAHDGAGIANPTLVGDMLTRTHAGMGQLSIPAAAAVAAAIATGDLWETHSAVAATALDHALGSLEGGGAQARVKQLFFPTLHNIVSAHAAWELRGGSTKFPQVLALCAKSAHLLHRAEAQRRRPAASVEAWPLAYPTWLEEAVAVAGGLVWPATGQVRVLGEGPGGLPHRPHITLGDLEGAVHCLDVNAFLFPGMAAGGEGGPGVPPELPEEHLAAVRVRPGVALDMHLMQATSGAPLATLHFPAWQAVRGDASAMQGSMVAALSQLRLPA